MLCCLVEMIVGKDRTYKCIDCIDITRSYYRKESAAVRTTPFLFKKIILHSINEFILFENIEITTGYYKYYLL